jgi:hypothetical protein
MDADDFSYPTRIEKQFLYMEKHPDVVISGSSIEVCNENLKILNRRKYPKTDKAVRNNMFKINPFAHPAVIFKKDAVKKVGNYNPFLSGAEDFDLYFRMGREGLFANLSETLLKLRTHSESISANKISSQLKISLYIRLKAISEYGYRASISDKFYFFFSMIGIVLIPDFLKFSIIDDYCKTQRRIGESDVSICVWEKAFH